MLMPQCVYGYSSVTAQSFVIGAINCKLSCLSCCQIGLHRSCTLHVTACVRLPESPCHHNFFFLQGLRLTGRESWHRALTLTLLVCHAPLHSKCCYPSFFNCCPQAGTAMPVVHCWPTAMPSQLTKVAKQARFGSHLVRHCWQMRQQASLATDWNGIAQPG